MGKVLFVDEAYRLAESTSAREVVNGLIDGMTKPKFADKMVIILARYDDAMNKLLQVNPGLSSRFPEEVIFQKLDPKYSMKLLEAEIAKSNISFPSIGAWTPGWVFPSHGSTFGSTIMGEFKGYPGVGGQHAQSCVRSRPGKN